MTREEVEATIDYELAKARTDILTTTQYQTKTLIGCLKSDEFMFDISYNSYIGPNFKSLMANIIDDHILQANRSVVESAIRELMPAVVNAIMEKLAEKYDFIEK